MLAAPRRHESPSATLGVWNATCNQYLYSHSLCLRISRPWVRDEFFSATNSHSSLGARGTPLSSSRRDLCFHESSNEFFRSFEVLLRFSQTVIENWVVQVTLGHVLGDLWCFRHFFFCVCFSNYIFWKGFNFFKKQLVSLSTILMHHATFVFFFCSLSRLKSSNLTH